MSSNGGTSPRLRRAAGLSITLEGRGIVVYNFLTQRMFRTSSRWMSVLAEAADWTERSEVEKAAGRGGSGDPRRDVDALIELTALLEEGSSLCALDEGYASEWPWGTAAGVFHFGTHYLPFASDDEEEQLLRERVAGGPASPPLFTTNEGLDHVVDLPTADLDCDFQSVVLARRTERNLASGPISLASLATCLGLSLRITGFAELPLRGSLPLKPTPSAGGRNPFEAFLYVRNVDGLRPGTYHYSATEHSLGLIQDSDLPPVPSLIGDQDWTRNAAAVVFLVGVYERMAWRYAVPSAYASLLIEAGHIAQNMCLAGKACGLATAPSGAFNDEKVDAFLGIDDQYRRSTLYCIVFGERDAGGDPYAYAGPEPAAGVA